MPKGESCKVLVYKSNAWYPELCEAPATYEFEDEWFCKTHLEIAKKNFRSYGSVENLGPNNEPLAAYRKRERLGIPHPPKHGPTNVVQLKKKRNDQ